MKFLVTMSVCFGIYLEGGESGGGKEKEATRKKVGRGFGKKRMGSWLGDRAEMRMFYPVFIQ